MRKLLILSGIIFLFFTAAAQETTKQKEAGINFQNLSNFGISYKFGSEHALWRMNANLNGYGRTPNTFVDGLERKEGSLGYGISIGREMRKSFNENFEWRYGIDLFTGLYQSRTTEELGNTKSMVKTVDINYGFNLVFGISYMTNSNIVFGAEILPNFYFSDRKRVENPNLNSPGSENTETRLFSGFNYNVSTSSARLTIAYRF